MESRNRGGTPSWVRLLGIALDKIDEGRDSFYGIAQNITTSQWDFEHVFWNWSRTEIARAWAHKTLQEGQKLSRGD